VRLANRMLERLDVYLSACQLGITLASLGLGWVGEPVVAKMLEPAFQLFGLPQEKVHFAAFPVAFFIITYLHLTVGEQAPKIGAIQRPRTTTLFIAYPLAVFYRVFRPFIFLINVSSNAMLRAVGLKSVSEHDQAITEDEVRVILTESAAMGHLGAGERRMLENVLDLEDKIARRHMVRRSEVLYLDRHDPMKTKLEIASQSGHTRFPLCEGGLDHVVGIVHIKDVFKAMSRGDELTSLVQLAREPLFLPETVHLDALLKEFQRSKNHMAVLVDEYGSASGIITIENVLEEMVGPIEDEFDAEVPLIVKKGEGRFEVEAACPIDEFTKKCDVTLPAGSVADSVGGLLIETLARIPRTGEKVRLGNYEVTVLDSEATRVVRVLIERLPRIEKNS
ncbi:MAG: hemolysin family protein, partial [Gemmatimonadota bacterium]|nr:hemolysin family protein [Gemmatimonadota bacterium]